MANTLKPFFFSYSPQILQYVSLYFDKEVEQHNSGWKRLLLNMLETP